MSTKKQIDDNLLAAYIDGRTTPEEEERVIKAFKESSEETDVYLLATQAAIFVNEDYKMSPPASKAPRSTAKDKTKVQSGRSYVSFSPQKMRGKGRLYGFMCDNISSCSYEEEGKGGNEEGTEEEKEKNKEEEQPNNSQPK